MKRRDFVGISFASFLAILLPWFAPRKRFHDEYYGTVTIKGQELMGYRGRAFREAGYVYAPYVPLYKTPMMT